MVQLSGATYNPEDFENFGHAEKTFAGSDGQKRQRWENMWIDGLAELEELTAEAQTLRQQAIDAAALVTPAVPIVTAARDQAVAAANSAASLVTARQPCEIVGADPLVSLMFSGSSAAPAGTITGSSGKWVMGQNGLLTYVPAGTAPIEYDPITAALRGLVIESARTNLALRSQELGNAVWTKQAGVTVTDNTSASPDGTTTADAVTATNNSSYLFQSYATTTVTAYTLSVWMRVASGTRSVDLMTNFVGGGGLITQSCAVTTTWQRFSFTRAASTGLTNIDFGVRANSGDVICWGWQLEAGPAATSYIPTTSPTVTRAADVNSITLPYTVTSGTIYAEVYWTDIAVAAELRIDAGGNANQVGLRWGSALGGSPGQCGALVNVAGSTAVDSRGQTLANSAFHKLALAFGPNGYSLSADGSAVVKSTASIPSGLSRLIFGDGSTYIGRYFLRRLEFYPAPTSDSILPLLTA